MFITWTSLLMCPNTLRWKMAGKQNPRSQDQYWDQIAARQCLEASLWRLVPSEPTLPHAGPEHEHTLDGSPRIVRHLLPQALLFPLRVHPIYTLPVAHTWEKGTREHYPSQMKCLDLLEDTYQPLRGRYWAEPFIGLFSLTLSSE